MILEAREDKLILHFNPLVPNDLSNKTVPPIKE